MERGHPAAREVIGLEVTAITLDSGIQVYMGDDRGFVLRVERDFELADPAGTSRVCFEPLEGAPPAGLDKLAATVTTTITGAVAGPDGSLRLELSNSMVLTIQPDDHYEAWMLAGPETTLVSLPGGGLG